MSVVMEKGARLCGSFPVTQDSRAAKLIGWQEERLEMERERLEREAEEVSVPREAWARAQNFSAEAGPREWHSRSLQENLQQTRRQLL